MNARSIFEHLCETAAILRVCGCSHEMCLKIAQDRGEPIPEKCRPGYMLTKLTEEERKALSNLKSSDTINTRTDWLIG